jgi:outer membrane lipoprotein SlyB
MRIQIFILAAAATLLAGCASNLTGDSYSRAEARQETTIRKGVVESVRFVKLEGTKSGVGTISGGIAGGIGGGSIGGGRGSGIFAVLGAVAGGLAGSAAEEALTREQGIEVTVQLDDGSLIAVVQEAKEEFAPGDAVRVMKTGRTTRVTRAPSATPVTKPKPE